MRDLRFVLALLVCLALPAIVLRAQTQPAPARSAPTPPASISATEPEPKTPEEFFARARRWSDLEASGIPFHIKASFVDSGDTKVPQAGVIEEWRVSQDTWRIEAEFGKYRMVSICNPKGPVLYATSLDVPPVLMGALSSLYIEIPPQAGASGHWRIQRKKLLGMDLVMLSSIGEVDCFSPSGILRIYNSGDRSAIYNGFRTFQSLVIPHAISIKLGPKRSMEISIQTLERLDASKEAMAKLAVAPKGLPTVGSYAVVLPGATAPHIIHQVPFEYPDFAKRLEMQGTIILGAIVGEDGKLRDVHVVKSNALMLESTAIRTVRQWRYKPGTVDGKPVATYTTITVDFSLNNKIERIM